MESRYLSPAIAECGRPTFWPMLHAVICDVAAHEMMGVFLYKGNGPPVRLYDSQGGAARDSVHTLLAEVGYQISPYYHKLIQPKADASFYRLSDVAPDDFPNSEYFHTYYVKKGVFDEAMFHIPLPDDCTVVVMVERTDRLPAFDIREELALRSASEVIVALVSSHFRQLANAVSAGQWSSNTGFRTIVERFGAEVLSNRERDVAMLILRGHSTKSAARELGIAPETERVHRRRLYTKLRISSHSELFWLFFESSEYFDPARSNDPLAAYLKQRAAASLAI